jgi:hypothetical protein
MLLIMQTLFTFYCKTSYLNEEVNCTVPSSSISVPWIKEGRPMGERGRGREKIKERREKQRVRMVEMRESH